MMPRGWWKPCPATAARSSIWISQPSARPGLLDALAGSKATEESEYRKFVQDSGFDYRSDLEAVAAAFMDGNMYATARGAFKWKRLTYYAQSNGGSCANSICQMPASQPGRFISFYLLRSNVLALAVSPDPHGVDIINPPQKASPYFARLNRWRSLRPDLLFENAGALPPGARAFLVSALEGKARHILRRLRRGTKQSSLSGWTPNARRPKLRGYWPSNFSPPRSF